MSGAWRAGLALAMAEFEPDKKPAEVVLPPIDPGAWSAWANEAGRTDVLIAAGGRSTASDDRPGLLVEIVDHGSSWLVGRTS